MDYLDITEEILLLRNARQLEQIAKEVDKRLQNGVPKSLELELTKLLKVAEKPLPEVIKFPNNRVASNKPLAQTELLAAAGQELGHWFDQPIRFSSLELDVRSVIGTDDVDVYISTIIEGSATSPLNRYKGKVLNIRLTIYNVDLLTAHIYVDETGTYAEGEGKINKLDNQSISGVVCLEVIEEN